MNINNYKSSFSKVFAFSFSGGSLRFYILFSFAFFFIKAHAVNGQIIVQPSKTAAELAQKLTGPGVIVSNPVLTCPDQANGFFNISTAPIGIDSGILLTTGRAMTNGSAIGVNGYSSQLASNNNAAPGDSTLDILAGQSTVDACKLEFDVIPVGDTISIRYEFSSEEYKNAVCGPYNDAFAFFISGGSISGADNMALVPGTNIPVTINSINNGIPGSSGKLINCTSIGAGSPFTSYYIDNATGSVLTHQGLTTVLKAIHAVTPCTKYHLKIVIADAGDPLYDSGVFLEAGSLQSETYSVRAVTVPPRDTAAPFCVKGCLPGRFRVRPSKVKTAAQTINFTLSGSAVSGVDYSPIADSITIPANDSFADVLIYGLPTAMNGTKTLKISIYAPGGCGSISSVIDSATLLIYDTLSLVVSPKDTSICRGDTVMLRASGDDIYTYQWSPLFRLSSGNVSNPLAFPVSDITYSVIASLPGTSCPSHSASVRFQIKLTPSVQFYNTDTTVCYAATFGLSAVISPANPFFGYSWVGPDNFAASVQNPTIANAQAANQGVYQILVTNDTNGCVARGTVVVNVNIPALPGVISPSVFCLNTLPTALAADGTNLHWYTSATDTGSATAPLINTSALSSFQYFVTQTLNECESPKAAIEVEVKKCCDGIIFIPTAFTPNNDGRNDFFKVQEDYGYTVKDMMIYNRWGQVIYHGNVGSWDGKFNNTPADEGTYFYKVTFSCVLGGTVERVGDVTLIR